MSGRVLSSFQGYRAKVHAYAHALEIKIEYRREPGHGVYMSSLRKVVVDPNLKQSTEIATLLHELGHSLDDTFYTRKAEKSLSKLYKRVYTEPLTGAQLARIVECERRAWILGRSIAKQLRIPLGRWFDREEEDGLRAYATPSPKNRVENT